MYCFLPSLTQSIQPLPPPVAPPATAPYPSERLPLPSPIPAINNFDWTPRPTAPKVAIGTGHLQMQRRHSMRVLCRPPECCGISSVILRTSEQLMTQSPDRPCPRVPPKSCKVSIRLDG